MVHISRHPDAPTQVQQGVAERRCCVGVERAELPLRFPQPLAATAADATAYAAAIAVIAAATVIEQRGGSET